MSIYTTQVRWICESAAQTDQHQYNSIDEILTVAAPKIFNFSFPMFDEAYRLTLEKKILRHYYTREISEETVGLWKLRLEDKLNLIMPYYNQLYDTTLIKFNPIYDVDVTTQNTKTGQTSQVGAQHGVDAKNTSEIKDKADAYGEKEAETYNKNRFTESSEERAETNKNLNTGIANSFENNSSDRNTDSDNTHWKLYSDTPQGGIEGIEGTGSGTPTVNNNFYLTNATKDTDNTEVDEATTSQNERNETTNVVENSEYSGNKAESVDENEILNKNRNKNNTLNSSTFGTTNSAGNYNKNEKVDIENLEQYTERIFGKRGSLTYSKMIEEFRDIILNIDAMIIDELADLFFGLWA